MKLSIVIVSWKVRDKLRKNLEAIFKSRTDFEFEVFVVDNNSEDNTAEMIKKYFPRVRLIENTVNLGFAKANNQVISQANSEYVLLLNPDMRLRAGTLQNAIDWADKNPQASVTGIKLTMEDEKNIKHVRRFPTLLDQLVIILKLPRFFPEILKNYILEDFDYSKPQKVDSIRGAFFLINKNRVKNLKLSLHLTLPLMDNRYFLWFEEVDYCRQVRHAGGEVWYTPAAECVDLVGGSFKQVPAIKKQLLFRSSMLKYFKKWHALWEYWFLKIVWPIGIVLTWAGERQGLKSRQKT